MTTLRGELSESDFKGPLLIIVLQPITLCANQELHTLNRHNNLGYEGQIIEMAKVNITFRK